MSTLALALPMLFIFHGLEEIIGMRLFAFIGLTFHYVVHLGQAIVLRKYIPALATSIVCLPISILFLYLPFIHSPLFA